MAKKASFKQYQFARDAAARLFGIGLPALGFSFWAYVLGYIPGVPASPTWFIYGALTLGLILVPTAYLFARKANNLRHPKR